MPTPGRSKHGYLEETCLWGATKPPKDLACGAPHSAFPSCHGVDARAGRLPSCSLSPKRISAVMGSSPKEGPRTVRSSPLQEIHSRTLGGLHLKTGQHVFGGTPSQPPGCGLADSLRDEEVSQTPNHPLPLAWLFLSCGFTSLFQKGFLLLMHVCCLFHC